MNALHLLLSIFSPPPNGEDTQLYTTGKRFEVAFPPYTNMFQKKGQVREAKLPSLSPR